LSVTCYSTKTYTVTEQLADRRAVTRDQTALSCWAAEVDAEFCWYKWLRPWTSRFISMLMI